MRSRARSRSASPTSASARSCRSLHDKAETDRAKGKPLKEIGEQFKLPFREIAEIDRARQDGPTARPPSSTRRPRRIAEAMFAGEPGRRGGGLGAWRTAATPGSTWSAITPEKQKTFDEVKAEVRRQLHRSRAAQGDCSLRSHSWSIASPPARGCRSVAKEPGAKVVKHRTLQAHPQRRRACRTTPCSRPSRLAKGAATSAPTADGKARVILQVADIIAAPFADPGADRSA